LCFPECHQKDITFENKEPVLKASYNDGETVKVNCMTGYTGMYKLKCEQGKWKTVVERPCASEKMDNMMTTQFYWILNQCHYAC